MSARRSTEDKLREQAAALLRQVAEIDQRAAGSGQDSAGRKQRAYERKLRRVLIGQAKTILDKLAAMTPPEQSQTGKGAAGPQPKRTRKARVRDAQAAEVARAAAGGYRKRVVAPSKRGVRVVGGGLPSLGKGRR
jgi:hypothetical protein